MKLFFFYISTKPLSLVIKNAKDDFTLQSLLHLTFVFVWTIVVANYNIHTTHICCSTLIFRTSIFCEHKIYYWTDERPQISVQVTPKIEFMKFAILLIFTRKSNRYWFISKHPNRRRKFFLLRFIFISSSLSSSIHLSTLSLVMCWIHRILNTYLSIY